jgi:hypothetical protein
MRNYEAEKVAETQPDAGFLATIVGDGVLPLATAGSLVLGGGFAMLLALATAASLMVGLALTFPPVTPLKSRTDPARTPRCMRALASNTPPRQFREPPGWRLARRTSREGGEPGCRGLGREEAVAAR